MLCASVGVDLADVEQILIGGAFGQYLNVEKAIRIGLLPDQPVERFHFLGNTSALGAYAALLCVNVRHEVADVASKMTYLELSADNTLHGRVHVGALPPSHRPRRGFPSVARGAGRQRGRAGHAKRRLTHDHHDRRRRQGRDRQDDAGRPAHPPAGGGSGRPDPRHRRRPASNLNTVLDLPLEKTVGDVREETSEKARANLLEAGIAKRDLLDYEINSSLVEGVGVDLLAMGRPEGPGCYCAANNMLRLIIDKIADSYPWVVIDNEAGLEHLSRRTTRDVDVLLHRQRRRRCAASRPPAASPRCSASSRPRSGEHYLIVNRAAQGLTPELEAAIAEHGLDLLAVAARTTRWSPSSTPPASRSSTCRPTAR